MSMLEVSKDYLPPFGRHYLTDPHITVNVVEEASLVQNRGLELSDGGGQIICWENHPLKELRSEICVYSLLSPKPMLAHSLPLPQRLAKPFLLRTRVSSRSQNRESQHVSSESGNSWASTSARYTLTHMTSCSLASPVLPVHLQ